MQSNILQPNKALEINYDAERAELDEMLSNLGDSYVCGCSSCNSRRSQKQSAIENDTEADGSVMTESSEFNTQGLKWPQSGGKGSPINITYSIGDLSNLNGLSTAEAEAAVKQSFGLWSSVTPLTFSEVENGSDADITFEKRLFGGNQTGLAEYRFVNNQDLTNATVSLDSDRDWNQGGFTATVTHEIGHSLGLEHEDGVTAIMNSVGTISYDDDPGSVSLFQDDIDGIQSLYGSGGGDAPAPAPEPEVASEPQADNPPEVRPEPEIKSEEPEAETPEEPEAETPEEPEAETPEEPEAETPEEPEAETPEEQEAETPEEPEAETPKEPEAETPKEPEAETPEEPEAETPKEPEAETPEEPEADNGASFEGTEGDDVLTGDDGANVIKGFGGNDYIEGRLGLDNIDGGEGSDTVDYSYGSYAFDYDLNTDKLAFQAGGSESLTNIENVVGSQGDDRITSNGADNTFEGSGGADTFVINSLDGSNDTIKDFSTEQGDRLELSRSGFGSGEFSYDTNSGGLFYEDTQFAVLENKPSLSALQSGVSIA